jgi:hypothetical protein
VQIVHADAWHTGLPGGAFDLVHARMVLVNIPRPGQVVAEMARLAKPGGWVAALEADSHGLCYPPHPALDHLTGLLAAAVRGDGADPQLRRRLPTCSATRAWPASGPRPAPTCTRPATRSAPCSLTCPAPLLPRSSNGAWPARPSSTRWMPRPAAISPIPTR